MISVHKKKGLKGNWTKSHSHKNNTNLQTIHPPTQIVFPSSPEHCVLVFKPQLEHVVVARHAFSILGGRTQGSML